MVAVVRLLIVGRGIAGSMLARHAVARGHDVTVVADPSLPPASLAALCVVRPDWFATGSQDRADADWSLAWYQERNMVTSSQVRWSSFRGYGSARYRAGFYAVDPVTPLVTHLNPCPLVKGSFFGSPAGWVVEFAGGFQQTFTDSTRDDFDAVALCLGSHSDRDAPRSWGATTEWEHDGFPGIMAFEDRPRNAMYSVSHYGTTVRFGSSKAPSQTEAVDRQRRDEAVAVAAAIVPQGDPARRIGCRLMPGKGEQPGLIRRLDGNVWACDGFGRVGYSLAPARTVTLLNDIEQGVNA